jgi:hypothetical protein
MEALQEIQLYAVFPAVPAPVVSPTKDKYTNFNLSHCTYIG